MSTYIVIALIIAAVQIPFAFSGMNNPYRSLYLEERRLLKKRFAAIRHRNRLKSFSYRDYEDRVYRMLPYVNVDTIARGFTTKRLDYRIV